MGEFVRVKAQQKVGCMAVYNQDWCVVWVNSIKSEEMCLKVHRANMSSVNFISSRVKS